MESRGATDMDFAPRRRPRTGWLVLVVTTALVALCAPAAPAGAAPVITPSTLSVTPAHVGQAFSAALSYTPSATWSVTSGTLPPGLTLSGARISGTPKLPGAYTFVVRATDATSTATKGYTIFVRPATGNGYDSRADGLIADYLARPWPDLTGCNDHRGYLNYATAALWLNQNVADANAKLAAVQISHITGQNCDPSLDPSRSNLWLAYLVRPYMLFNANSSFFPGRMTTTAANNLLAQMWAYANPYSHRSEASDTWSIYDSENHDAQAESFDLLSAQAFKNSPSYSGLTYADGSTPAQQYQAWRAHWSAYFDERAKRGLFVEVGSPTYTGYTVQAILNIYNFAEDPLLRKKAGMLLDLDFADFAQQSFANVWGGAKSRSFPSDSYDGNGDAMTDFGDLVFGPAAPFRNNHMLALATSGYVPPDVIRSIALDRTGDGSFEYVTRRPGVGSSGWDVNKDWHVDPTRSIVDSAAVTPDYVVGAAELNPANTDIAPSSQNRWQGVTFATTSHDRVYPQAAPTSVNKTADAFWSVEHNGVLITRKNGYASYPTLVYFPSTLDAIDEIGGWLFVHEGGAYLAVRPASGTYSWLTSAKNKATSIDSRFVQLSDEASPIIFEAARAVRYASFSAFETDVMNNPMTYSGGVLTYTASDGEKFVFSSPGTTPTINGVPINFAPANVFNSPYMQSAFGSGKIRVAKGTAAVTYDFSDPANPVETVQ